MAASDEVRFVVELYRRRDDWEPSLTTEVRLPQGGFLSLDDISQRFGLGHGCMVNIRYSPCGHETVHLQR